MRKCVVLLLVIPCILCVPDTNDEEMAKTIGQMVRQAGNTKNTTTLNLDPIAEKSTLCTLENGEEGECVTYYLCDPKSLTVVDDGSNILDVRILPCPHYLETCCKVSNITTITPVTPSPPPRPNARPSPDPMYSLDAQTQTLSAVKTRSCGWDNPTIKIFETVNKQVAENSFIANYGDFPFMVAIIKRNNISDVWTFGDYLGGGALIHPSYVLTAAHKVAKFEASELKCRAGEYDTQTTKEQYQHQERNVKRLKIHEQYYRTSLYNDVALLTLESPFSLAPHIGVACLGRTLPPEGTPCFAMGWGKDFNNDFAPAVTLKKVKLDLVSTSTCDQQLQRTRLGPYFHVHSSLTCAGGREGVDTCRGDGGSPLVCSVATDGEYTRYAVFGLVAYGISCGDKDVPGVYVNVPEMYNWIDAQIDKDHVDKTFVY